MWKQMNTSNIGKVVENVSRAMKTGAVLEIEWDPHVSICATLEPCDNPFIGIYDLGVTASICYLHLEQHSTSKKDRDFIKRADMKLVEQIRAHLRFYEEIGVGSYRDMVERICLEMPVFLKLMNEGQKVHLECNVRVDPTAKTSQHEELIVRDTDTGNLTQPGHVYNLEDFLRESRL
eukprot:gene23989-30276_t